MEPASAPMLSRDEDGPGTTVVVRYRDWEVMVVLVAVRGAGWGTEAALWGGFCWCTMVGGYRGVWRIVGVSRSEVATSDGVWLDVKDEADEECT